MKAKLAELFAKLEGFEAKASITDAEATEFNATHSEYVALKNTIEAREKIEAIKGASNRQTSPIAAAPVAAPVAKRKEGFQSVGEFLNAVKAASHGEIDPRFSNAINSTRVGEDGGFLVPEEMINEVQKKLESGESLFAKTRQFKISGNTLSLPVDESAPWNNGVNVYWTAEGQTIAGSKPKIPGIASWKLNKLAALVPVTDELLDDAVGMESYIMNAAPEAIMHAVNSAILTGTGVGKPSGILNSGFKYKVLKESGQAADTIVAKNVIKMYSRLIPSSLPRAAWYVNAACVEQLRLMKDDNDNFIYIAPGNQLNQGPYATLLGLPVIPMVGSMKALGDEGDIILADLSYYYSVLKTSGMKQAISTHLYFDKDQVAYKFTFRIDGKAPFSTPVETENGAYKMSAIVTLEDR